MCLAVLDDLVLHILKLILNLHLCIVHPQRFTLQLVFGLEKVICFLEKTLQSGFLSKQIRHFDIHEGLSQFLHRSCRIVCEVSLLSLYCSLDEKFVQVEVNLRDIDSIYVRCFLIDI